VRLDRAVSEMSHMSAESEVITMNWNELSHDQKIKHFSDQLVEIRQAKAVLERFESLTQNWLKKLQTAEKKPQR
jgi:hypothetical protein